MRTAFGGHFGLVARTRRRDHGGVVRKTALTGTTTWFTDARTPARRMAVTAHPEDGVVIVSFWRGDQCTATFQLPLDEGAALVAAVADGMAAALPAAGTANLRRVK